MKLCVLDALVQDVRKFNIFSLEGLMNLNTFMNKISNVVMKSFTNSDNTFLNAWFSHENINQI